MDSLLPKCNRVGRCRLATEKGFEALSPDQGVSGEIPIPNYVPGGPGNQLIIILGLPRSGFLQRVALLSIGFGIALLSLASLSFPRTSWSCCSCSHLSAVARTREKLLLCR